MSDIGAETRIQISPKVKLLSGSSFETVLVSEQRHSEMKHLLGRLGQTMGQRVMVK